MGNESSSSLTHILMLIFLLIQRVNYAVGHEVTYAQGMLNARVRIKMLQGGTQGADIAFAQSLCTGEPANRNTHYSLNFCYNNPHKVNRNINLGLVKTLLHCVYLICSNRELWCDRVKKET